MVPICAWPCLTKASCSLLHRDTSEGQGILQSHVLALEQSPELQPLFVTGGGFSNTTGHESTARVSKERCHHIRGQAGSSSRLSGPLSIATLSCVSPRAP